MTFFWAGLSLLFIGLKLTGYVDWSWVWVLAPLWVLPAVTLLLCVIIAAYFEWFEPPGSKAARLLRKYGDALTRRK